MQDETRVLRTAQANLIAIQAARIALLEARVEALVKRNAELEAQNKRLVGDMSKGVKGIAQA